MDILNIIKDFIVNNYPTIIFAVIACLGFYLMGRDKVKKIVVQVMLQAEKYVAEDGATKKDYVVERAYELLPPILKPFVSKALLGIIVEEAIDYIKDDYNKRIEPEQQ